MIHEWSARLARYLGSELALTDSKVSIITYGLEVLIGGIIKLVIYVTVPLLFGVFNQFAVAFISAAGLRLVSGGYHCTAYYRCLIYTLIIYLAIAFSAKYLAQYTLPAQEILLAILGLAFIISAILAPVDVPEKPIISNKRRRLLKITSCIVVIVYAVIFIYWQPSPDIVWACNLAILSHLLTLTKPGHGFIRFLDNLI